MSNKHVLMIAGMHRSGTSALCSALQSCGVSFGANLLAPMEGVNEEGFWEDAAVVRLNEEVLQRLGGTWYCPPRNMHTIDWSSDTLADLTEAAGEVLERGFGEGELQALKDPRLCLTLPLWLRASEAQQLPATVGVMSRAPMAVAQSLSLRDGFPLGYGLRLYAQYRNLLVQALPPNSRYVTYDDLLQDPASVMQALSVDWPLTVPASGLSGSVNPRLRHHTPQSGEPLLLQADTGSVDPLALEEAIERAFPVDELLTDFARGMVERGEQLTGLGTEHTEVLSTLNQRDADVEGLSALHLEALATIDERDAQIVEFDRKLTETGEHLGRALDKLRERDEQVQRILSTPVVGVLLRAMKWL